MTTFDTTEVVFAREEAVYEAVRGATSASWTPEEPLDSVAGAIRVLEPLVLDACRRATADLAAYRRHMTLLDAHEELRARDALKNQQVATELARALVAHGAPVDIATLAAQLAVACYSSGRILAGAPGAHGDLVAETRAAFRRALVVGSESPKA